MKTGRSDSRNAYHISGHLLRTSEEAQDLGVLVTSALKLSAECFLVFKKASMMLQRLRRTFADFTP